MAFSTKLFRLTISSNFYTHCHVGNDFLIEPTLWTSSWMRQRNIRCLSQEGSITLIWLTQCYDDPLKLFHTKATGVILSFALFLKNSQALNFLELEVGYPTGQVYYLHNGHANDKHLLHESPFMGRVDLARVADLERYPIQPSGSLFALIDIDLNHWFSHLSQVNPTLCGRTFVTYCINIKSRATFWRYHLIDTEERLKHKPSVVANDKNKHKDVTIVAKDKNKHKNVAIGFTPIKVSTLIPNAYCTESTTPIAFCDQYHYVLSLYGQLKNEIGQEETLLLEKLPYPTANLLKREGAHGKRLYSDCVVYF